MDTHHLAILVVDRIAPISRQIWEKKYRLKHSDGTPVDLSIEDSWRRIAAALAAAEGDPELWEARFYEALAGFKFLPAGRILAGAGTRRRVTLFNCFVMGDIPDDLNAIFDSLREAAVTMQHGGGIGGDFSTLRPKGALVKGVDADASGPLSFMNVWNEMCETIMSAGARRGAMMATMRCDHPDIEAFVTLKSAPGRLKNFNLSVLVTDRFMAAVDADENWDLIFDGTVYRTVQARALWDLIMMETYAHADPGVLFIDRINRLNNLSYCEVIGSTNPCGEEPLPPYGACLLGSINLTRFIPDPFTPAADLDEDLLAVTVATAVRMLDNVIDVSGFALDRQESEAKAKRRIGLGITGLASTLMMAGARYGSHEAITLADRWMRRITREAYIASARLAAEKGPFPYYERDAFLASPMVQSLDPDVRDLIAEHGIRNALLTAIAPTGTISLLADNVSSGIEPVFALSFARAMRQADGSTVEEVVEDHAVRLYRSMFGKDALLPAQFVTANDLTPADHVRMQAALQRHVDSAISKTVNVPEDISFDDFKSVYRDAYAAGCKGCTTYRPNKVTGAILKVAEPDRKAAAPADAPKRSSILEGRTHQIHWGEHAFYVTINDHEIDGQRQPYEIFINSKNLENQAWMVALTRIASAMLRRGGDVSFLAEELKEIFDPRGGQWIDGTYVPSLPAAIGRTIEHHVGRRAAATPAAYSVTETTASLPDATCFCPRCQQPAMTREGSCSTCHSCGFSTCS